MAKAKVYKMGAFQYGYVSKPSQISGRMEPFRPHWWAQYMGDGTDEIFKTKKQALAWIKEWNEIGKNPPMYAHHLYEKKTHGLNLKQMRRLYAMVSRGNQKAITFARNVLGIPFDETASQVKAVVKHHVLDLAERRVRRNPYLSQGGKKVLYGYAKDDIKLLGTGLKISKGELVLLTPATNIPGGGYFARPGYPTGIWKQVSEDDSIYLRPSEIKSDITFRKPVFGSKSFGKMIRGNPSKEILGQKKELVRVASEIAQNLISHFGPSMGYEKVANSELLPRSVRIVMNAMTEPEGINYEKYSMYFPRSYNRSEWQERGNMANHLWLGQTDRGRNEVIRKGIEIAKRGKVYSNRRRRRK
ncbi:hypothetical protein EBR66_07635 [bacterium]|nr:hypothetical protein [bacterium]